MLIKNYLKNNNNNNSKVTAAYALTEINLGYYF